MWYRSFFGCICAFGLWTSLAVAQAVQIQQIQIRGNVDLEVSIKDDNGEKTIDVKENGNRVTIKELRTKEITVRTETTQGDERVIKEVRAKDLEDLKKKNADAAGLYEKYARNQNAGAVAVAGGGGGPVQIQIGVLPVLPMPGAVPPVEAQALGPRTFQGTHEGKKIEISDEGGKRIVVKVTETKDGENTTQTYKAATYEELKKEHAEIAKIYVKFAGEPPKAAEKKPVAAVQQNFGVRNLAQQKQFVGMWFQMITNQLNQIEQVASNRDKDEETRKSIAAEVEKLRERLKKLEEENAIRKE